MSENFRVLQFNESQYLNESGSNQIFWKNRIIPYLKGSNLWPYVSGTIPKPLDTEPDKLMHKPFPLFCQTLLQMSKPVWTVPPQKPLGQVVEQICSGRPYSPKFSPDTTMGKAVYIRWHQNLAWPHSQTPAVERGLYWSWS